MKFLQSLKFIGPISKVSNEIAQGHSEDPLSGPVVLEKVSKTFQDPLAQFIELIHILKSHS